MAELKEWAEIYLIANDLKQADSRVAKYVRRAIELNPDLKQKYSQRGYTLTGSNGSTIEAIPIDPSGEAGSNADMLQWSELWGSSEDAKQRMFAEMTLSPTKHGQSFRWIESYAGFAEESLLLWSLYETGVKNGELIWPDRPFHDNEQGESILECYRNEEASMFCLWNTHPRCSWQTEDYYRSERAVLTPNEFARMHRNTWVTSEETYIPIVWWDSCIRAALPIVSDKTAKVVSLDAAVSDDTFGITMGYRHPDNPDDIVVEYANRWIPPANGRLDFQGTEDNPGPELALRKLIETNNVILVTYDEHQLADMAGRLSREGLAWFKRFGQGNDRLVADSMLRDKIRDRRIWHTGLPHLREHLQNSNAKIDVKEDRKIRIVKRTQNLKIDLAVCLSQMVHEINSLNL